MGQIEVYEFLKTRRMVGDTYWSIRDVEKGLSQQGFSNGLVQGVGNDLIKLELSGYLETIKNGKMTGWVRSFRLKTKYIPKRNK